MSMAEPRDLLDVLARLEQPEPQEEEGLGDRRFKRFAIRDEARLESIDADGFAQPMTVLLRDISRGGVGFLVDTFIEPGTLWRVRFMYSGHVAGSQPVVIRFCRLVQDNLFIAGGQFIIEPYILHKLGISERELADETLLAYDDQDVQRFLGPDEAAES